MTSKEAASLMGEEYLKVLTQVLLSEDKKVSGDLINSLSFEVLEELNGFTINIIANAYLQNIENGRKPGSMPPVNSIIPWVRKKGIRVKTNTIGKASERQSAFVIAKSIAKKGIKPTKIFEKTKAKVMENLRKISVEFATDGITRIIEKELILPLQNDNKK